ncbi:MAG TPA: OmpA family protein [Polyangium sp.]|nr:OmpA family protein [Polyangium sp.]
MLPIRWILRGCSAWAVVASFAGILAIARPSFADESPSLVLEPAPAGDRAAFVERAAVRGHLLVAGRLAVDYAHAPLVLVDSAQYEDVVVGNQTTFHALASISLRHRILLALDVPFSYVRAGARSRPGTGAPDVTNGADFGDIRFGARVRLYQSRENPDEGFVIGLSTCFWLPTASDGYLGDGQFRMRGGMVAEGATPRFYWGINGGIRSRPVAILPGILPTRVGSALGLGLSGGFFADGDRAVAIGAEFTGDFTVGAGTQLFDPRATVANLLLTGHYRIAGGPFEVGAAFGPGLGQGAGSSDVRVMVFLGRAPEQMAPPPDRDEDGIPDKLDACVSIKGITSSEPLLNGCPEAPSDRDGDAIPDDYDACPAKAGIATFVHRTHGCPKIIDKDGDTVADADDACPDEKGVAPPDGDGCPKKPEPPQNPPQLNDLMDHSITIVQEIYFQRGTAILQPESEPFLQAIAKVFVEHPEVELVEVQGHTDDTGNDELNRRLAQDRAEAVVKWLVKHGVANDRLTPKGYGASEPVASNDTEEGRAKNRRVRFIILRQKQVQDHNHGPAPSGGAP